MLGVTPYLTRESLLRSLKMIAAMPPGSGVVFDYAVPASSLHPLERIGLKLLAARVARAGEPFQLFLEPRELASILHDLGFTDVQDLGRHEINARYFQNRTDGLQIRGSIGRSS